ncbi:MAG: cupin domain-containing protein [Deltaproteobacteria bacterium]|nr:cupin domain-containing protein [Deltaproteobacteria bacterium]
MAAVGNIFADIAQIGGDEQFSTLLENSALKIERIESHFHSSPEGFWYDQAEDEWVMILRGEATLEFADGAALQLKEGDYLMIPRRKKHRVCRTGATTVWLVIHIK